MNGMKDNMPRRLGAGLLAFLAVTGLGLQQAQAADATLGADVLTAYVWRGLTFNDEGVVQPSVDVSHESGFGVNVWGNFDLGDYNGAVESSEFSEVDLTAYYSLPLEGVDVSVGFIEYLFPGGTTTAADGVTTIALPGTREVYVSSSVEPVENLSVGVDVYYDVDEFNGWYGSANLGYSYAVTEQLGVDVSGSLGVADGGFARKVSGGTSSGLHDWNLAASLAYAVTESVELGAVLAYTDSADTDVLPTQDVDWYGGGSLYWSF